MTTSPPLIARTAGANHAAGNSSDIGSIVPDEPSQDTGHPKNITTATYTPPDGKGEPRTIYIVSGSDQGIKKSAVYAFETLKEARNFVGFVASVASTSRSSNSQIFTFGSGPDVTNPNNKDSLVGEAEVSALQILLAIEKLNNNDGVNNSLEYFGADDSEGLGSRPININGYVPVRTLNANGLEQIASFDRSQFMGEGIPTSNKDLRYYAANPFQTTINGKPIENNSEGRDFVGIQLGGLSATAKSLYQWNYPQGNDLLGNTLEPLDNNDIDPSLLSVLQSVFGQTDGFNAGHINTLAMLKIAGTRSGSTNADNIHNWLLTQHGLEIKQTLDVFNGGSTATQFLSDLNLSTENADILNQSLDLSTFIQENNGAFSFKSKDSSGNPVGLASIKEAINTGYKKLTTFSESLTPLPDDLKVGDGVKDLLTFAFGSDAELTTKYNALIGAGLVQYDPNTKQLTLTPMGTWVKEQIAVAPPEVNPEPKPPEPTPPGKLAKSLFPLAQGWKDLFDVHFAPHRGDKEDDYISLDTIRKFAMGRFEFSGKRGFDNVNDEFKSQLKTFAQQFFDAEGNSTELGKILINWCNGNDSGNMDSGFIFGEMQKLLYAEVVEPEAKRQGITDPSIPFTITLTSEDNTGLGLAQGETWTIHGVTLGDASSWWVPQ